MEKTICRCGIADWRELRLALNFNQAEFAALLVVSLSVISRAEARQHCCPSRPTLRHLHDILQSKVAKERLALAGYDPYAIPTLPTAQAKVLRIGPLAVSIAQ